MRHMRFRHGESVGHHAPYIATRTDNVAVTWQALRAAHGSRPGPRQLLGDRQPSRAASGDAQWLGRDRGPPAT